VGGLNETFGGVDLGDLSAIRLHDALTTHRQTRMAHSGRPRGGGDGNQWATSDAPGDAAMMDRLDFEMQCIHVEEPGAMCIKCAWGIVSELKTEVKRLRGDGAIQQAFRDGLQADIEEANATIATLREALKPLAEQDCESWGCHRIDKVCQPEEARKALTTEAPQ